MGHRPKTPWEIDSPAEPIGIELEGRQEFDFVVVGAGLTGLALAYHLKRDPGSSVCLLEAESVGSGASGRTGGILMNGTASEDYPGTEEAIRSLRQTIEREGISCDLRLAGCLELDRTEEGKGPPIWEDHGRLVPVGCAPGGDFHPGKYLSGIARALKQRDTPIFEKTPVMGVEVDGRIVIQTPKARIVCSSAIFTTNNQFLRGLKIADHFIPYNTYAIASEPLSRDLLREIGWETEQPFYTLSLPFLWGRTTSEGRIVIGSFLSSIHKVKAEMMEQLEERFHSLHPALEKITIEYRWWGPLCIPHDWTPKILTSPLHPRILYLGGYAGHGCALSHLFALRTAAFLSGDSTALDQFAWARGAQDSMIDRVLSKMALKAASNIV